MIDAKGDHMTHQPPQLSPLSGLAAWLRHMGGYAPNEGDRKACSAWAVELQAALSSQAPADERSAFISWMNGTYPDVYEISDAEHCWHYRHVSALAWQARAALQSRQPAAPAQHWTEKEPVRLAPSRIGRVYIAGPMSGLPEFNFPAFNAEAAALRAQGFAVLNPAEHGIVEGADWADYLRHDIAGLASCERIHLLPGWSKSKGARLEHSIAVALGMVITLHPDAEPADHFPDAGKMMAAPVAAVPANPAAWVKDSGKGYNVVGYNSALINALPHGTVLQASPTPPVQPMVSAEQIARSFRWDSDAQHHVPTLLIEFEPVPANAGSNAKGWKDRDAMAAAITAAQAEGGRHE
jgi:Domain of unknown function (DUF4406)